MNWDQFFEKWGRNTDRQYMEDSVRADFINDQFACYENEGFSKKFWTLGNDFPLYDGKSFVVKRRLSASNVHESQLPMWEIQFQNGETLTVYPDEVIPREMRENGCKMEGLE